MRAAVIVALMVLVMPAAAQRIEGSPFADGVSLDDYLALLERVAPPAREGAEAYIAAFRARCGRALRVVELRRAFAEGSGDPTLLAMVRAAHARDTAAIGRLGAWIVCPRS